MSDNNKIHCNNSFCPKPVEPSAPAPSAPVINPQIANSATQTSLRVCWSLFSDDTVESYELYYRPVLEDAPADGTCVPPGTT